MAPCVFGRYKPVASRRAGLHLSTGARLPACASGLESRRLAAHVARRRRAAPVPALCPDKSACPFFVGRRSPTRGSGGRTSPSNQKTRIRKTRGVRVSSWSDVAGSSSPAPHYTGVTARSAPRLRRNFAPGGGEGWGRGRAWGGDLCACARAGSGPPTWCVVTLGLGCSSLVYLSLCLTERHRVTRAPTRLQPHT